VRDLAEGDIIAQQRHAVLVGGTGTGKTHLAIAIGRAGSRGRFFKYRRSGQPARGGDARRPAGASGRLGVWPII